MRKALCVVIVLLLVICVGLIFVVPLKWNTRSKLKFTLFGLLRHGSNKLSRMKGWRCLNTRVCKEILLIFHEVMGKYNVPFWLSEGTALGVRRERDFIHHDDDVDIALEIAHRSIIEESVVPELIEKHNFHVTKVWNRGRFITLTLKGETLDIDMIEEGKPCMSMTTTKMGSFRKYTGIKEFVSRLLPVSFLGKEFLIPDDSYFERIYGKNWLVPQGMNKCSKHKQVTKKN